jgi:hypothetical protein
LRAHRRDGDAQPEPHVLGEQVDTAGRQ